MKPILPKPQKIFLILIATEIFFVTCYLSRFILQESILVRTLFDMNGEGSFPAFFSGGQFFLIASLIFFKEFPNSSSLPLLFVRILAGTLFLFFGVDEMIGIHEEWEARVLNHFLHNRNGLTFSVQYIEWMMGGMIFLSFFLLVPFKGLLELYRFYPKEISWGLGGFFLLIFSAVGIDWMAYRYFLTTSMDSTLYALEVIVEEFLEMCGGSLVLCSTYSIYLKDRKT